ncbi:unnamed protein product, partial [Arabidopsis halleri]
MPTVLVDQVFSLRFLLVQIEDTHGDLDLLWNLSLDIKLCFLLLVLSMLNSYFVSP